MNRQITAPRRLTAILEETTEATRATITELLPALTAATADDPSALRLIRHLPGPAEDGSKLFPTTNCPGCCEICGACRDDCMDCEECSHGSCEICLP